MRKRGTLIATAAILSSFSLFISSCKKSHETPVKPNLSMEDATRTVKESDGTITVNLVLDRPALSDLTVTYSIDGSTAREKLSATSTNPSYDYTITSDYLETTILKGETSGAITLDLSSDFILENDEIIDISILSVDKDDVVITREDETKITVTQEDGLLVVLEWGVGDGENYTDVDMDLFTWAADNNGDLGLTNIFSAVGGFAGPEFVFLPTALMNDGTYGLSANYYSGTQEPMNFQVSYVPIVNDDDEAAIVRTGTYTLANVNAWDVTESDPLLEFTFEKSGTEFTDFSQVTVPDNSSRTGSHQIREIKAIRSHEASDFSALQKYWKKK